MNHLKKVSKRTEYSITKYSLFKPIYKGSIASEIYKIYKEVLDKGRRIDMKPILAWYFSTARPADLNKGVGLSYKKMSDRSLMLTIVLKENNESYYSYDIPIFDNIEVKLLGIVFDGYTKTDYDIIAKEVTLRSQLTKLAPIFNKYVQLSVRWNATAIRHLRIYALQHDNNVDTKAIYNILRLRRFDHWFSASIPKDYGAKYFNKRHGIAVSEDMI